MDSQTYIEIVQALSILSLIEPYQRLSTETLKGLSIEAPSIYQSVVRSWRGETRQRALAKINMTIEKAFNIIDGLLKVDTADGENVNKAENLVSLLKKASKGVSNMSKTYEVDTSAVSYITAINMNIDNRLTFIDKQLNQKGKKQQNDPRNGFKPKNVD